MTDKIEKETEKEIGKEAEKETEKKIGKEAEKEIEKKIRKEIVKEMKQEMKKSEIQPESGESSKLIGTPCGAVRGTVSAKGDCIVYKGIRYANAKRFQYPEEVTHWDGIYEADRFGNCSYQPRAFYDEAKVPEKAFYYHEFREGESYTYSEDCLFLNIWAPLEAENAPVLFYIHGGGFKGGCGHEKHFDGAAYCRQGILVVTINYRLGPLGFACMEEWKDEAGHAGNYAMYDQMAALSWVRRNIAAFGGNPDRITLMGQSAGAMSVQQHCLSPLTKGSICGAIMMSGGGVREGFAAAASLKDVEPFWRELDLRVTEACGKGLREAEPSVIFEEFNALSKERPDAAMVCGPIVDGAFLPEPAMEIVRNGGAHEIPYLMGSTSEDIVPPIVHKMAKGWARLQSDLGRCPSYAFFFDRQLPGDDRGAWHSADLWYEFGTLENSWRPFEAWDRELSDCMVRCFANFIRTGDPNGGGLPQWLPVKKGQNRVMRFGDKTAAMGYVSIAKLNHTMRTKPSVGE